MKWSKNRKGYRECTKCKMEKPLTKEYFHADKNRMSGLMYRCKECEKIRTGNQDRHDRWKKTAPLAKEKIKANQKKYAQTSMGKAISFLNAYKKADKAKGTLTTLTKEDVLWAREQPCFYCGFEATGFDRLDNTKGHTKENCVPACAECNVARMDNFTSSEMLIIAEGVRFVKAAREKKIHGICLL